MDTFLSFIISISSSLSLGDGLKCLKGPLNYKQPTNQPKRMVKKLSLKPIRKKIKGARRVFGYLHIFSITRHTTQKSVVTASMHLCQTMKHFPRHIKCAVTLICSGKD